MTTLLNVGQVFRDLQRDVDLKRESLMVSNEAMVRELSNQHNEALFLAIDPRQDKRMVLIPLAKPSAADLKTFPVCQGMKLNKDRLSRAGSRSDQTFLIIRQTDSESSIFEAFAANICERLWHCHGSQMLSVVKQTLEKWKAFFRNAGEDGLAAESRRGLYGELYVLRLLLDHGFTPDIVQYWDGPLREDVDFLFRSCGVEVKTTLSQRPLKVSIASEEQLSGAGTAQLFLAVLPLQVSRHDGETLCDIVESVRQRTLDWPLSRQALDDRLIQYGYLDLQSELYRTDHYQVLDRKLFHVDADFPRIEPLELRPGVINVQYQIILDGCGSLQRSEAEVIQAIQGALADGS